MAILLKGSKLTITVQIQVVDMFAIEDIIYYLARYTKQEEIAAKDLTSIPLLLICTDPEVKTISEEVLECARSIVNNKYTDESNESDESDNPPKD